MMRAGDSSLQLNSQVIVKRRPFEAEYEQINVTKVMSGRPLRQVRTGTVHRDSEGRTRKLIRQEFVPEMFFISTVIFDPVGGFIYTLEEKTKAVSKTPVSPAPLMPGLLASASDGPPIELGEGENEGVVCRGYRLKHGDSTTHLWYSGELKESLFERTASEHEERVYRLFNIRRGEPDGSLFSVPADYKEA
jgi:hypothetical protein